APPGHRIHRLLTAVYSPPGLPRCHSGSPKGRRRAENRPGLGRVLKYTISHILRPGREKISPRRKTLSRRAELGASPLGGRRSRARRLPHLRRLSPPQPICGGEPLVKERVGVGRHHLDIVLGSLHPQDRGVLLPVAALQELYLPGDLDPLLLQRPDLDPLLAI